MCLALLLLLLELTVAYLDGASWKLAFNIHGSDGHLFGYAAEAWEDETDVGTDAAAFTADYKNYDATTETANFIAIVRHQNGSCEAARVWQFLQVGKTLHDYLDSSQTTRYAATADNHTYSFISNNIVEKARDPIFSVDGGLVFNWLWWDNGVRIGNSKTVRGGILPGRSALTDWIFAGFGNSWAVTREKELGFDVGVTQDSEGNLKTVQGKDHGTLLQDGTLYGHYAIYISDDAKSFPCKNINLKRAMYDLDIEDFSRIDESNNGFVSYDELVFAAHDSNKDGRLSLSEYSKARAVNDFRETVTDADVAIDFDRIDEDEDGFLKFREVAFDIADKNKDGKLSLYEFSRARADNILGENL